MAGRPRVTNEQMLMHARQYVREHHGLLRGGAGWNRWAKRNGAPLNSLYSTRFDGGFRTVSEIIGARYVTQKVVDGGRRGMRRYQDWREAMGV